MKDPENEKCEMEETKEEALMENPHLMKSALIELRNLIIKAEEYVEKVIVLIGKILKQEKKIEGKHEIGQILYQALTKMKYLDKEEIFKLCKENSEEMNIISKLSEIVHSQVLITEQLSKA